MSGNYLYVANWTEGVKIFDISDPANPEIANTIYITGAPLCVYVSGNYAYTGEKLPRGNGCSFSVARLFE